MSKNFYITTTLPYVNSDPHIGFATEIVNADAIARYRRLRGDQVFFSTGTDEHGQKIWEASQKEGRDVKEYTDHFSKEFKKLKELLNLTTDNFIRTTDESHIKAAQEIWKKCEEKGDIYKKSYTGKYCVGCESFKTEKDLNEEGKCFIHPHLDIKNIEEENYFFKLSKYGEKLLDYLQKENSILPQWRREEAINFVKGGLEDFSISREKERLSWGIPVPGDEGQVMYVWFDALTNYISTLGWPEDKEGDFKKFWDDAETVQVAGKDQVRFQSIMWQAMLMSAEIKNTDRVVYHGFINSGGQKMSKSLGNVISPYTLVDEFGVDAVRYLLLRHVHPFEDSDVTMSRLKELYNADLANGVGNLTSRILTLSEKYLEKSPKFSEVDTTEYYSLFETFDLNKAVEFIWKKIGDLDLFIQNTEPFKVIKVDKNKGTELILEMVLRLNEIGVLLEPVMPETSKKILELVTENKKPTTPLFLRKD